MKNVLVRTLMVGMVGLSSIGLTGIDKLNAQEPELTCADWSGCSVSHGLSAEFIPQIQEKGMLAENALTLINIANADLVALSGLKDELSRLKIENSPNLTDLSPVGELTNLRSIELALENVTDFSALAALTNLVRVTFKYGEYADVAFLEPLSALRFLNFSNAVIHDLAGMHALTNLEELGLEKCTLQDLSPLADLPLLTRLSLNGASVADAASLGALTGLTRLSIQGTRFADYGMLANCTALTALDAMDSGFDALDVITAMPELFDLYLIGSQVREWEALATANLFTLTLAHTSFCDLSLLAGMDRLNTLNLDGTTITHPEVLASLPGLMTLSISGTQGMSDITILKDAPKLSTLQLAKDAFPQEQIDALKAAKPDVNIQQW